MDLAQRLHTYRSAARLTQQQVADVLHIPRESISMWENGSRVPGLKQLEDLARLYSVSVDQLLGDEKSLTSSNEREVLCRGLVDNPAAHMEFAKWFAFLDGWADIVESEEKPVGQNAGKPPKKLDRGPDFTDSRAAATLAADVRSFYDLGTNAIPDMYSLLDEHDILVCKANLGDWSDSTHSGISGAFHNHPKLGYCILVNAQNSVGRQSFTLAHEFAHALYHYNSRSLISTRNDRSPREYLADAFATHFLVPTKEMNRQVDNWGWKGKIDPYKAIELAHVFRVSYVFMLYRLRNERHITEEDRKQWSNLSPAALARQIGIDSDVFNKPGAQALGLERYPTSVLQSVRDFVLGDALSVSQAADLLDISQTQVRSFLLSKPTAATEAEQKQISEFVF